MNHSKSKLTPIQVLICKKQRLIKQRDLQEELIVEHIGYIQQNAGGLILKGLKSILFPTVQSNNSSESRNSIGESGYLATIKNYIPILWEITRPVFISWGMNKLRRNMTLLLQKL